MIANTTAKVSTEQLIEMVAAMKRQTGQFRTFHVGVLSVVYDVVNESVGFYIDNGLDSYRLDDSQVINAKVVKSVLKSNVK